MISLWISLYSNYVSCVTNHHSVSMGQELASSLVGWCGPGRQKAEQACSLPRGWQGQEDLPQDGPPTGLWAQGLGVSPHGPPGGCQSVCTTWQLASPTVSDPWEKARRKPSAL